MLTRDEVENNREFYEMQYRMMPNNKFMQIYGIGRNTLRNHFGHIKRDEKIRKDLIGNDDYNDKFRIFVNKRIEFTKSKTGLSFEQINLFLRKYGFSEIIAGKWEGNEFIPKEKWIIERDL